MAARARKLDGALPGDGAAGARRAGEGRKHGAAQRTGRGGARARRALTGALLLAGGVLLGATAPELPPGQATPVQHPYNESLDAHAAVAAAFARAKATGRKVMLDFGGNWCPDCRMLAGVLEQPSMRGWLGQHFELVMIDVGRFDRNTDIPARWGITLHAVPSVLVLTPDGKLIDGDDVARLENARNLSQQGVAGLLDRMAEGN